MAKTGYASKNSNLVEITFLAKPKLTEKAHFGHFTLGIFQNLS